MGFSKPDSERISSCFDSVEGSAEDLSLFASFVFSRRVLMKVREVLAVVEFSKVCPCASEKAICCGAH